MSRHEFGDRFVDVSNEDKVFFPEAGLTKGDVVEYYERVAPVMLPHLRDRPVTMRRFPDGVGAPGFYHKRIPGHFPDWFERVTVRKEGGEITHPVCNDIASLVYLADQGCVTPHVWLSRADRVDRPDRLVFDLDPPGDDLDLLRRAARRTRDAMEEIGLTPFLMTTGSSGVHVVAPIERRYGFDRVRGVARRLAKRLARRWAGELTVEQRKDRRRGRVFLDYLRNAYGQTSVAPYAVRARASAPVATPLDWDELGRAGFHPRRHTIANLFRRLGRKEDPWRDIDRHAARLDAGALEDEDERTEERD